MPQLVVTVHPNGSIETLLKDRVLDTRKFANKRRIERVSEIIPANDGSYFFVVWHKGPLVGYRSYYLNDQYYYTTSSVSSDVEGHPLTFDTYEAGVEYEIATVNAFRLAGHSFA